MRLFLNVDCAVTFRLCLNFRQGISAGGCFFVKIYACRDSLSKIQTQSKSHSTVDIQKQPHNVNYTILFNCRDQYVEEKIIDFDRVYDEQIIGRDN